MKVTPPWTKGQQVGLFASRSPLRPNPIGLSVVRVKEVSENRVYTSGLDVFDNTPLLDIKPYINDLDSKCDANNGWVQMIDEDEHLALHIQGIPHNY
jgi:tRNA-Thr(GGU) m(6)t(6)A37 methyltransferase TsaA